MNPEWRDLHGELLIAAPPDEIGMARKDRKKRKNI